ncbi:MAG: proprotein convertase P-domain-containing protein [Saprospiraceae bacterium]|nr:proprotein convertase P-domain-containing protein [Saprospiraceae bacterium]
MSCREKTHLLLVIVLLYLAVVNRGVTQSIPLLSNPSACQLNLPIVDNNCPENAVYYQPNEFHIQVNNAPPGAMGLQVYLKEVHLTIRHTWAGDLDVLLIAPNGRAAYLTSDNGGGDDNYGNPFDPTCEEHVTFAVGACTSITQGMPPFTNTIYRPEDEFYVFNDSLTAANGI